MERHARLSRRSALSAAGAAQMSDHLPLRPWSPQLATANPSLGVTRRPRDVELQGSGNQRDSGAVGARFHYSQTPTINFL